MPTCTYYIWAGGGWAYLGSLSYDRNRQQDFRARGVCTLTVHHCRTKAGK